MYQIDQSFTRLTTTIDFSDVALDGPANGWCVLGTPPKQFLPVHSPALILAWHERLVQALVQPTRVENRRGHRRVQVLGTAIFNFDADGQVHLCIWTFNDRDLPELEQLPDHAVVAAGVPYRALWADRYRIGALRSLVAHYPDQDALCQDYALWASQSLIDLCWSEEVQGQVRAQIDSILALDVQVLEIASQIQRSTRQRVPVRLEHYNHVLAFKNQYLQLQQESPQFIALYALLADEIDHRMELTRSMRTLLRRSGLGTAVWRLLSRVGTDWINEFLPYFDQAYQSLFESTIEILKMATTFGTQFLPPTEVLHALIQLGGNPNSPAADFVKRVDDQFDFCKRLGAIMARADAPTMEAIRSEAMKIFQWSADHAQFISESVMRRLTLKGILRRIQTQAKVDRMRHESAASWQVPFLITFEDSHVTAVILNSALLVWQEGQLMHHCAATFIERCACGELVMLSIRDTRHRHPLATVSFQMTQTRVQVHKFSGFANRRISDEVFELIQDCRRQLQAQRPTDVQQQETEDQSVAA